MNKKILLGIAALAIAGVSAVNVNFNSRSNKLSDISLANAEALAQEGAVSIPCCELSFVTCTFPIINGNGHSGYMTLEGHIKCR